MSLVAPRPFESKLEEVFRRTLPKLGPEVRGALAAIITPESLKIIAGVLAAWVLSHAFGVGEAIDIILAVLGIAAIGLSVFSGLEHIYEFASRTYRASSEQELDTAAEHLAKAITILGITAVLAVLFRGRPTTGRGGKLNVGAPPPRTLGIRYKPTITRTASRAAGEGSTSAWGDIRLSMLGSANDQKIVLLHELVHQFLTPKLYLLRNFRVENLAGSYVRSSLWRYLEEALAETVAQVGVNGLRSFFVGIRFPVKNGYVYLTRGGGFNPQMTGGGLVPEGAALIAAGSIAGLSMKLWFSPR